RYAIRTLPVCTYSLSRTAKLWSCHCLQYGHWKSLISTSQIGALSEPRILPRSALVLIVSVSPPVPLAIPPPPTGAVAGCAATSPLDAAAFSFLELSECAHAAAAASARGPTNRKYAERGMGVG